MNKTINTIFKYIICILSIVIILFIIKELFLGKKEGMGVNFDKDFFSGIIDETKEDVSINRYDDPSCNDDEYLYCLKGKLQCQDFLGNINTNMYDITDDYTIGKTYTDCSSYYNKIKRSDFTDISGLLKDFEVGDEVLIDKIAIDDMNINFNYKELRETIESVEKKMSEFDLLSMFPNIEREDIFNLSETEIIRTLKENGYNEQFKDFLTDLSGSYTAWIINNEYYTGIIDKVNNNNNDDSITIDSDKYIDPDYDIQITDSNSSVINIPKHMIRLKWDVNKGAYNPSAKIYFKDIEEGEHIRPVCENGIFTKCLKNPPFKIENNKYIKISDELELEEYEKKYTTKLQQEIDQELSSELLKNDFSNIGAYNQYGPEGIEYSNMIKCVANHGTEVGEPLCCDQIGKLKSTSYVCPEELPLCRGYLVNEKFGYCT